MSDLVELPARVSAHPWSLYQAEHLAGLRAGLDREGFFVRMLKDDLQKQRYAYEVALVPQGVEWSVASRALFALLNDFNHMGYGRDPAALVFDFADSLLDESIGDRSMLLELHALPRERNRASRHSGGRAATDGEAESLPSLGHIPRWSVLKSRSSVVQVAMNADQPSTVIPSSSVRRAEMRATNRPSWQRTIKELSEVDKSKTFGDLERLSWKGYASSEHVAVQDLAVAASTVRIGWDARGSFNGSVTSPYLMYRQLRFVRFWVEVLEDVVAFLNRYTSSNSIYGDDAFIFSLSNLPSPRDLTKAMQDMRSGSLTVENAYSTYLSPKYAKRRSDEEVDE